MGPAIIAALVSAIPSLLPAAASAVPPPPTPELPDVGAILGNDDKDKDKGSIV